MKKIWIMNHYATGMFASKGGRHYWFARELKKRGYDVTVFCSNVSNGNVIDTKGKGYTIDYSEGIPFVFVETKPSQGNGVARMMEWYLFYKHLFPTAKRYAKEKGIPDVIIASSVHPLTMVAGLKIAKRMKVPCICEVRDLWPEAIFQFGKAKEKSLLGKALIRGEHWIYKTADALIFTKEGDTDYLKEKRWTTTQGGDIDLEKCHYINNGVDLKAFDEEVKTFCINDADLNDASKFNVTYAGTIRPVNNVGNLLDTAVILGNDPVYSDVQFIIYGDGVELPGLQNRVENEHLTNVKLKGRVNKQYIPYILSRSSVNMLNYSQGKYNWTRGNSSNKLFEYMASGKPIVSTVHMSYSIIKRYNCGIELNKDTPEALAQEIKRFHDMTQEQRDDIGRNAREGAKDFDITILTQKLIKVIESVTNG